MKQVIHMHPVGYLFDEIYRDYWGIPAASRRRERKRPEAPSWRWRKTRPSSDRD